MALFSRSRPAEVAATPERSSLLGLDLNSSRARALAYQSNRFRLVLLDEPHEELPLAISLEKRHLEFGRAGLGLCRKLPHLTCLDFLPCLGQTREWRTDRHRLDAAAATGILCEELRKRLDRFEGIAIALPSYLTLAQVTTFNQILGKTRLPVRGTVCAPLALAADRAALGAVTSNGDRLRVVRPGDVIEETADRSRTTQVRRDASERLAVTTRTSVLVVDIDEYALTGAVVSFEREQARLLASTPLPRLGLRFWKERLLDAMADRCIQLCRRDPRDSAVAEQALYEQLEDALDRTRAGQVVDVTVRSDHWFQNLVHQPDDFDGFCAPLVRQAVNSLAELVRQATVDPPAAVWVTHAASRLPGLVRSLHQHMTERTQVIPLPPNAIAQAAANLVPRWMRGELPRVHLDTSIPLVAPAEGDAARRTARGQDATKS